MGSANYNHRRPSVSREFFPEKVSPPMFHVSARYTQRWKRTMGKRIINLSNHKGFEYLQNHLKNYWTTNKHLSYGSVIKDDCRHFRSTHHKGEDVTIFSKM